MPAKAKSKSSTESRASRKSFSLSRPIVLIAVVTLLIASLIALNFASSPNNESGSTENVAGTTFEATALQVTPTSSTVPDGTSTPTEQSRDLGIGSTMVSEKDGMMMVFVPEGEFTMGGNDGDSDEKPVHAVFLDAFWIDQTEVTNVMYSMCAEQRACDAPNSARSFTRENYFGNPEYDDYPVINVSWDDANTYCAWAGRRLPSEAEWEKAARGIDAATYPWGNDPPANTLLNYNNAVGDTAEVGSYPAGVSSFGALDMAGNVWEWVSSSFEPYPYDANDGREDLTASGSRILRGASWDSFEIFDIRSSFRGKADPSNAFNILGFRCALSHSAL
jgi:serine/threonine-protein kinase